MSVFTTSLISIRNAVKIQITEITGLTQEEPVRPVQDRIHPHKRGPSN